MLIVKEVDSSFRSSGDPASPGSPALKETYATFSVQEVNDKGKEFVSIDVLPTFL